MATPIRSIRHMRMLNIAIGVISCSVIAFTIGCVPNRPNYERLESAATFDKTKPFDFGILEYSDHGNLFNRQIFDELMQEIERTQLTQPTAIVIFVHGWHHNSDASDANLVAFKDLLLRLAAPDGGPFRDHRVIGIYVGWRGSSIKFPLIDDLTFWDRKAVAGEVGRGGVTEALLTVERVSRCGSRYRACDEYRNKQNRMITIGHSFGGAIVLSALSDVFVDRLVNAKILPQNICEDEINDKNGKWNQKRGAPCAEARQFGHGVVLLNPAIEANQVLPLKEIESSFQYPDSQHALLHVLSSEGDLATRIAFPIGQSLNNLTWSEAKLVRKYAYEREDSISVLLNESSLTETSVGNYSPIRTGWIGDAGVFYACWDRDHRDLCKPGNIAERIPIGPNEPIQFYLTDKSFMQDHNDVFNCLVRSYITAIAMEAVSTSSNERLSFGKHYAAQRAQCAKN